MEVEVDERKIWWIASYPKSGNTWVRMFINAYITGFPLDINSGFQYAHGDNNAAFFQSCACRPVDQLTATEQVFIRPAVLIKMLSMSAAKHVCLKTHHAKVIVDGVPLVPPKLSAGGVYLIRDPRDVAISFSHHLNETLDKTISCMGDIEYTNTHRITNLMHILTTWSMHVKSWTEKNKNVPIETIRYEDMLEDPNREFRKILKGLGFDEVKEDRFQFALEQTSFSNLRALEDKYNFREKGMGLKFFRVGKAKQWEKELTPEQVEKVEKDHWEVMHQHGYEPSKILTQ